MAPPRDAVPHGRLRVAHVTTVPDFVELILLHDLRRMRDRVDATVFCAPGPGVERIRAEGFRVETIPIARKLTPWQDVRAVWALAARLRRERFDVVHSWVPKGGLVGQLAAALAGIPVRVHSCRGLLYTPGMAPWRRRLYRGTDRLTSAIAQRTLYNSAADHATAVGDRLCAPARARYTGTGIDLTAFRATAESRASGAALRASLGIPADAPVVASVGRYVADKGYPELLRAAALVHARRPDARFVWLAPVLAGEEGMLDARAIDEAGLGGVVHRLVERQDPRAVYAAADVLVHASHREGVPRVLMEAAAMGVPLVATDIAGCREVIDAEDVGLLVPVGDAQAIADAILRTLGDPDAARARADRAAESVRARFDQDGHSARLWAVYEELVGGRA